MEGYHMARQMSGPARFPSLCSCEASWIWA